MRHADLQQEAAAVVAAKPVSALLYDTWYCCVVPGMGVCLWWDGRCHGLKNPFSTASFDWQIQSKKSVEKS